MAKLTDKFFNRVIEGELELSSSDKSSNNIQEKLVSGTNIKTINGNSLLGSGNIAISSGTKLYKHNLTCKFEDGSFYGDILIVTANGNTYNLTSFEFGLSDVVLGYPIDDQAFSVPLWKIFFDPEENEISLIYVNGTSQTYDASSGENYIHDSVTPL